MQFTIDIIKSTFTDNVAFKFNVYEGCLIYILSSTHARCLFCLLKAVQTFVSTFNIYYRLVYRMHYFNLI